MDASQYKDYVLGMLFIKYVSDKYADAGLYEIPPGATFADMVALKGTPHIGDSLNKKVFGPLYEEFELGQPPDWSHERLGRAKERVERLTELIAIFEDDDLDFSKNKADGDDLLGDAYEYLMRHFATESGKSKGQFYTPAEVSRVLAQILGIRSASTSRSTTVYDPTCGSGSLLLKVADEATTPVTLYGQEKDSSTAGLARMNMLLHGAPDATIQAGNTLASPLYRVGDALKTFDYVVANPPFSDKRWTTGVNVEADPFERFAHGTPPTKQGDYAYLLHIIRSLKSTGRAACILPHGVLFRGNAEAAIRQTLVKLGYIQGIIGLPANLFYGTGIPACVVVIDRPGASKRDSIFMIDASKGFIKDGNKNRLRAMDIHRIVDVFTRQDGSDRRYARRVPHTEIEQNDYNLNIPRYIDSQDAEDIQDIEGHLRGGIPVRDVDALDRYWAVCPDLRVELFVESRPGYVELAVEERRVKATIQAHPEFEALTTNMRAVFAEWQADVRARLRGLTPGGFKPKALIVELGEAILSRYAPVPLVDRYAVYQHLRDYWAETMQDDAYLIAADGWVATPQRIIVKDKQGREKDKGWVCDLVPKALMVARYFEDESAALVELSAEMETASSELVELDEKHGEAGGALADVSNKGEAQNARSNAIEDLWRASEPNAYREYLREQEVAQAAMAKRATLANGPFLDSLKNEKGNLTLGAVRSRLKSADDESEAAALREYLDFDANFKAAQKRSKLLLSAAESRIEAETSVEVLGDDYTDLLVVDTYLALTERVAAAKKAIKAADTALDDAVYARYATLTAAEVKALVVDDKWLARLSGLIEGELDRISQALTGRVTALAERYAVALPELMDRVAALQAKVDGHLARMGFV